MAARFHNPIFKQPDPAACPPVRSPTPPRRFIERLSPAPSKPTPKPAPIEPHFNYPAINNNIDFTVHPDPPYTITPKSRGRSNTHQHAHHRTPSNIDTLAEAALGISPHYQPSFDGAAAERNVRTYMPSSEHGRSEPPHKRARSELLPSPMGLPYASRPATSYENTLGWRQGSVGQRQAGDTYDNRLEEASLLLNFASRTNGWPSRAHHLPPPPAPSSVAFSTARPHANSFPQDVHQPRPIELAAQAGLLPPFNPQDGGLPRPMLPSPQQTIEESDSSPGRSEHAEKSCAPPPKAVAHGPQRASCTPAAHLIQRPLNEQGSRSNSTDVTMSEATEDATKAKQRGWPKGKPRGTTGRKSKSTTERAVSKKGPTARKKAADAVKASRSTSEASLERDASQKRRSSFSDARSVAIPLQAEFAQPERAKSVPLDTPMIIRPASPRKPTRRATKIAPETICAGCATTRETSRLNPEMDQWISCNGCKKWYHMDCAGFRKAAEVRDVDKYFCTACEQTHGKTTYVRKSTRAHASVDYAELQRGVLKTSEESMEHHYIQPIKDGTFEFDPETFPRMRPELITKEFFERSNTFVEPICIPAKWNPRPWAERQEREGATHEERNAQNTYTMGMAAEDYEYDAVTDNGQDKLDMVMPENLTVRQVCNLVGPDTPLDVIDVKTQNSGSKWTLSRWADYYEEDGDDKPIRNVISLEVSQTKLGRLLQRPKIVRDIDLQDEVWPQKEIDQGKWPKVQFYCLMSVADSYTDFHIDFGGSSVYYHILKGKKTFFFIPPKTKHLKAYEEWNDSPQQNYTFLPSITKECYRVDLCEGDTMLIPSGWIHAVWTPETSLVIGGNFLNRMSYKNQFKVVDIEKANETPMKFRYPFFQKIMWYTAIKYMQDDPLPEPVSQLFYEGKKFDRSIPIWADFDGEVAANDPRPGAKNARYYGQAEMDGLPDLVNFIFRTVMLVMGRVEGITADRMKRVNASIPKVAGEPLEVAKTFALWVAWKRGNEDPPAWAHPDAVLPNSKEEGPPKKLSARALKEMERKSAIAAIPPERASARVKKTDTAASGPPVATSTPPDHEPSHPPLLQPSSTSAYAPPQPAMHHLSAPVAAPMAVMANGMGGTFISTPKTSVLGPKRVACDACRKRRIRCKHKDLVMQATPDGIASTHQVSPDSFSATLAPELHDNITVTPPKQQAASSFYANNIDAQQNGDFYPHRNGSLPNGLSMVHHQHVDGFGPNTNGYVNHNITPVVNGSYYNGEASKQRGRSKACFECRKSKRRCIHDESGNVDPIKAAETPVPRGSTTSKKRPSEDGTPIQSKKKPKLDPSSHDTPLQTSPQYAVPHGAVQHPQPTQNGDSHTQQYLTGHPTSQSHEHASTTLAQQQQQQQHHSQPPIDPHLYGYSQPTQHGPYAHQPYPYSSSGPYPIAERPQLYQLPSLEQIANDVLDFNDDNHESGHVQQGHEPALQNGNAYEAHPNTSSSMPDPGPPRPDESVDSAVSLPASDDGKQENQGLNGSATEVGADTQSAKPPRSTEMNGPQSEVEVENKSASGDATAVQQSVEAPQSASPMVQKSAIDSLPLYRPPAPPSQSPEQSKRQPQLTNGAAPPANDASNGTPPTNKRKRDSVSRTPGSKITKKARVMASADPPATAKLVDGEDRESLELARALQQDDLGLRRRRE